jgi:CRISPR/Cas system CSM-associated protein Csm3 (group 7 of RAMP superfamily)
MTIQKMNKIYTHRYIARVVLEAQTGLFVGSGDSSLIKDALVQKDHNGLPMIQGTSLTGVLRHSFLDDLDLSSFDDYKYRMISLWGTQFTKKEKEAFDKFLETKPLTDEEKKKAKSQDGFGSRLRVSSAYMLVNKHHIAEGLNPTIDSNVLEHYENLPIRQHVRINDKGVKHNGGLFDNEVVYKGTRFGFEIDR